MLFRPWSEEVRHRSPAKSIAVQVSLFVFAEILFSFSGCGPSSGNMGNYERFRGQALGSDGTPLAHVLVILQPTERGYEIELETDAEGRFSGEGIPGEYIYYFADSKRSTAKHVKELPARFLEPKLEHLVRVGAGADIVCKIE